MRIAVVAGMLAVALVPRVTAFAQMKAPPPAARAGDETLEQKATEALQRMSKYLQSLHSFSLKATTVTDHVLENGQKIQLDAALTMWFKRPDSLRVDLTSDRRARQLFYDGKHVTIYGKANGYFARLAAPDTLKELIGKLGDEYNVEVPLADLFTWDLTSAISRLSSAAAIGFAAVRGAACDQYAFRQAGLDWQVWIQRGAQPLPRRLVLTTTDDPARPQYSVDLDWKVNEKPAKSVFVFTPPAGSHEVPMRRADGTIAAKR
jgi:hypothetical protein